MQNKKIGQGCLRKTNGPRMPKEERKGTKELTSNVMGQENPK